MENQTNYANYSSYFDHWFERRIPFTYILMVYLLLGLSGNATVLYIYLKKFKTYSDGRFFILVLAVLDMVASVVSCSVNLFDVTSILNGALSRTGCKLARFLNSATTGVSVLIILVIAIDRYLKICRPNGRQMSLGWKRLSVAAIFITAVVGSLPMVMFVDMNVLELKEGLTANVCFYTGVFQTLLISYTLVQLLIIVAVLIIMTILYYRIYKRVFTNQTARVNAKNITPSPTDHDSDTTNSAIYISSDSQKPTVERDEVILQVQIQASVKNVPRSRMIVIFMVITIAFAICFIPKFVVLVLGLFGVKITRGNPNLISLVLFLRSFYICNNFINPFIYGFMDKKFQLKLKKMFCSVCCRKIRRMK